VGESIADQAVTNYLLPRWTRIVKRVPQRACKGAPLLSRRRMWKSRAAVGAMIGQNGRSCGLQFRLGLNR